MNLSKCVDNILPALPPAKIKKKKKKKKEEKKKKIPCAQWCRRLAWGNRMERPTDSEGKRKRRQTATDKRGVCCLVPWKASLLTEGSFAK